MYQETCHGFQSAIEWLHPGKGHLSMVPPSPEVVPLLDVGQVIVVWCDLLQARHPCAPE